MRCDRCHEREAEVHIRESGDDGVREHHLCRECAAHHALPGGIPILSLEVMMGGGGEIPSFKEVFKKIFRVSHAEDDEGEDEEEDEEEEEEEDAEALGAIPPDTPRSCPRCGAEAEEILLRGKIGCAECFRAFRAPLEEALGVHLGDGAYRGLCPSSSSGEMMENWGVVWALRRELDRAVALEAYERAAELRDRLQHLLPGGRP